MNGPSRGVFAGLTFLFGFTAALWLAGAAAGSLRGPRAALMREVNALRSAAQVPALRSDPLLGQIAHAHARALARGSALANASGPQDLERRARGQGWRGAGPLVEVRLRGADPIAELRQQARGGAPGAALLDPARTQIGVGWAPAADTGPVLVLLLAAPPAL